MDEEKKINKQQTECNGEWIADGKSLSSRANTFTMLKAASINTASFNADILPTEYKYV